MKLWSPPTPSPGSHSCRCCTVYCIRPEGCVLLHPPDIKSQFLFAFEWTFPEGWSRQGSVSGLPPGVWPAAKSWSGFNGPIASPRSPGFNKNLKGWFPFLCLQQLSRFLASPVGGVTLESNRAKHQLRTSGTAGQCCRLL